jgi:hypothetical protein
MRLISKLPGTSVAKARGRRVRMSATRASSSAMISARPLSLSGNSKRLSLPSAVMRSPTVPFE